MGIPQTPDRAKRMYDKNSVVFVGVVQSVGPTVSRPGRYGIEENLVLFEVTESIKGVAAGSTIEVTWEKIGCGRGFATGERYIMFVGRDKSSGKLRSSSCGTYRFPNEQEIAEIYTEAWTDALEEVLSFLRDVKQ